MQPSNDWQAAPSGSQTAPPPSGSAANPHAGMGMDPSNPHAGMGMDPSNPHAGMGGSGMGMGAGMTADKTPPKELEKLPDGRVVLGPFTLQPPKEWTQKPVTSSMRAAQFVLSDKAGEEADLVVYYFGEGGAGGIEANLDRWLGQFQQPDGKPSKDVAKIEKTKFAGQDATVVSVTGHYVAQAMPGAGDMVDKQDQSLLAAIVNSPSGPYYFKLVGAKKTVAAHTARFRAMLSSMKLK